MISFFTNKIPRFQFFHNLDVLTGALFSLPFTNNGTRKTDKFLKKMKIFFGREDAHLVSSFRMGLFYSLKALQLKPGDEVLLTPITIADTINSIKLAGLIPVLVDMDPDTHSVCLIDLKKKLTDKSKVLLVTYLSGIVPDIDVIRDFARTHNLVMIEDISQNMDASYKGDKVGTHGDISIASLSCGKNVSTLYGGLILSDDIEVMCRIKNLASEKSANIDKNVLAYYLLNSIKVQIATSRLLFPTLVFPLLRLLSLVKKSYPVDFDHDPVTKNNIFASSKPELRRFFPDSFYVPVNDWQIRLTHHQLLQVSKATKKRRELAQLLLSRLSSESLSQIPRALHQFEENSYYHFPIFCGGKKSELRKHLFLNGVDNGAYGLNLCSEEAAFGFKDNLPEAFRIKHDSLFLPLHESFTKDQILHIADAVNAFHRNAN